MVLTPMQPVRRSDESNTLYRLQLYMLMRLVRPFHLRACGDVVVWWWWGLKIWRDLKLDRPFVAELPR
jgi:hypothetical protein